MQSAPLKISPYTHTVHEGGVCEFGWVGLGGWVGGIKVWHADAAVSLPSLNDNHHNHQCKQLAQSHPPHLQSSRQVPPQL